MKFVKTDNQGKYVSTSFLAGALSFFSLGSEGCISDGGYYSSYHRHPSPRHIYHDPHHHYGSLDPRLNLQHEKLNNWYHTQKERAERRGFRPGELSRINRRYHEGLEQLGRGEHRRMHDLERRFRRNTRETLRRIERNVPRRYYRNR